MKLATKLQKALLGGQTVLVEFIKKDGSVRRAKVTKNPTRIPVEKHPKRKGNGSNGELITLFDVAKGDWICCYADKLTMVKTEMTAAQLRRKQKAAERWQLAKRIVEAYYFTVGEALSIASGKTVKGCNLTNLSIGNWS